jgi:hypothetical protein
MNESKSLFSKGGEYDSDLSSIANSLVEGFHGDLRESLIRDFIRRHWESLNVLPDGMSWFLPRYLGGYGLPQPRDFTITERQLRLATLYSEMEPQDFLKIHALFEGGELPNHVLAAFDMVRSCYDHLAPRWVDEKVAEDALPVSYTWPTFSIDDFKERCSDGPAEVPRLCSFSFNKLWKRCLSFEPMERSRAVSMPKKFIFLGTYGRLPPIQVGI